MSNEFLTAILYVFFAILYMLNDKRKSQGSKDSKISFITLLPQLVIILVPCLIVVVNYIIDNSIVIWLYGLIVKDNQVIEIDHFATLLILFIFICAFLLGLLIENIWKSRPLNQKVNRELRKIIVSNKSVYNDLKQSLIRHIDIIDNSTGWSNDDYLALNVDVSIKHKDSDVSKSQEFYRAISHGKYRDNIYKVIGEPGSGKSVALRGLCRRMLSKVSQYGLIPVYINMSSWAKNWNGETPTLDSFKEFAKKYVVSHCGVNSRTFIGEYFDTIFKNHGWFFVLDSFDEIPFLGCINQDRRVIDVTSEVLFSFLSECGGGVVASRPYLSPTQKFMTKTTFVINKFDDCKVFKYLKNMKLSKSDIGNIFTNSYYLIDFMSNPFCCGLINSFYQLENKFPDNMHELYKINFESKFGKIGNSISELHTFCEWMAYFMVSENQYLLEVPINSLLFEISKNRIIDNPKQVINALIEQRIFRENDHPNHTVSFVHRRYQEYFYVRYLINHESDFVHLSDTFLDNCVNLDISNLLIETTDLNHAQIFIDKCCEAICDRCVDYNASIQPNTIRAYNAISFMVRYCNKYPQNFLNERESVTLFLKNVIGFDPKFLEDNENRSMRRIYKALRSPFKKSKYMESIVNITDLISLRFIAYALPLYYPVFVRDEIYRVLKNVKYKFLAALLNRQAYMAESNEIMNRDILLNISKVSYSEFIKNHEFYLFLLNLRGYRYKIFFYLIALFTPIFVLLLFTFVFSYFSFISVTLLNPSSFASDIVIINPIFTNILYLGVYSIAYFHFGFVFFTLLNPSDIGEFFADIIVNPKKKTKKLINLFFYVILCNIIIYLISYFLSKINIFEILYHIFTLLFGAIGLILILIIIIVAIIFTIEYAYRTNKDKSFPMLRNSEIDREYLNKLLNDFKTSRGKRSLLNYIKTNNIKLIGMWNEKNVRPIFNNEAVDDLLSQLDIKDIEMHMKF